MQVAFGIFQLKKKNLETEIMEDTNKIQWGDIHEKNFKN